MSYYKQNLVFVLTYILMYLTRCRKKTTTKNNMVLCQVGHLIVFPATRLTKFSNYSCTHFRSSVFSWTSLSLYIGYFMQYPRRNQSVIQSDTDMATIYLLYLMFAKYILSLFHECQPINRNESVLPCLLFLNEPRSEKTGLRGFRPGPTQIGLYSNRRWLEA